MSEHDQQIRIAAQLKTIGLQNDEIDALKARVAELEPLAETVDLLSKALNRRVAVEAELWNVAAAKLPPLTPDRCRALALELGVPEDFSKRAGLNVREAGPAVFGGRMTDRSRV